MYVYCISTLIHCMTLKIFYLHQVKQAMNQILQDLNSGDSFSLLEFSNEAKHLITTDFLREELEKYISIVEKILIEGGTNINAGLQVISFND